MDRLTDLGTLRGLCDKYGFSLSKGLGQHFLTNPGICPKICDVAGIGPDTDVLEIGPGFGTLTRELAGRARKVVALEIDHRLMPVLDETLEGFDNVKVVRGDVMKIDLAGMLAKEFGGPAAICANLPYYITTPIIMRILEGRLLVDSITVMIQREAAQRITAAPGTRGAGAITYAVNYYAKPTNEFTVAAGSFYPPPKVKSAVVKMALRQNPPLANQPQREQRLFRLVRASFSQRRKTLANAASAKLDIPKQQVAAALAGLGLAEAARPEQLTLEQYIKLEAALWPEGWQPAPQAENPENPEKEGAAK